MSLRSLGLSKDPKDAKRQPSHFPDGPRGNPVDDDVKSSRTPESSLRGISIIWINFSKICLRFMIIQIKIANFRKNLTLLIRKDPADFQRLV